MGKELNRRKTCATLFSSIIFSMVMAVSSAWNGGNPGLDFIAFTLIILLYAGLITLVY